MIQYLRDNGITQRSSCPYTHEQNGCAERKHRHIVETGRSLLHHSNVPSRFWTNAFETAVYTISRLPTPRLQYQSPFFVLFQTDPDYSLLCAFGCLCFS